MRIVPVEPSSRGMSLGEAAQTAPHLADFGSGMTRIVPADEMLTGTIEHDGGEAIIITLVHRSSVGPHMGLSCSMTVEEARAVAAALIENAARLEQAAGEQAAAALRKVAGK